MTFMLIRRLYDGAFLAFGTTNPYYDEDIRNAIMYDNEEHAQWISREENKTDRGRGGTEVVYMSISLSNVRG